MTSRSHRLLSAGLLLSTSAASAATLGATPWGVAEQGLQSADMAYALKIFLGLTALSFIPAVLICMTCFVRIVIVLSMLRHAIGLLESPPNVVIILLALFLTMFSMQPVLGRINNESIQPYLQGKARIGPSLERGAEPLKEFMVRQTREQDLALMLEVAKADKPDGLADLSLMHLTPAFMLSELRSAFQIGFIIFLPFLLIDLIVASVLMALGMMMVPPTTVSVPLKLLLFVLIDGWNLVTRALLGTIH